MRLKVFKKKLEQSTIKDLKVRQLPPIEPKKLCRKSAKAFQRGLDATALERANYILSSSKNYKVKSSVVNTGGQCL